MTLRWGYNLVTDGLYVKDKTAHRIKGHSSEGAVTDCGLTLDIPENGVNDDGSLPPEHTRCGNCNWTLPTVEITVDQLGGEQATLRLNPGEEHEFRCSTKMATIKALEQTDGE